MSLLPEASSQANAPLDVTRIRADFPALDALVRGKPLVYLDNASTTHKPRVVLERMTRFYESEYANVHRGVHYLSDLATKAYEDARQTAQKFLNAADPAEIIFTRGTTEAINLVAHSFGKRFVRPGDEIIVSEMEHHSNFVPWQQLCEATGARLRVVPIAESGELLLDEYAKLLNEHTRLVAVVHLSNALGTLNPVRHIIQMAHAAGTRVLLDGAQAVTHLPVDVQVLDCDFYAFSSHKLYGPTGSGILYGKRTLLEEMPPWMTGGDMVDRVQLDATTYDALPFKFEAGTPNIAGAIGLGAAIDYVTTCGFQSIAAHEASLLEYATQRLHEIPGLRLIGTAKHKAAVLSFTIEGVHPSDLGELIDQEGIAIRAGHHCAQPLMDRLGLPSTARASFACYNTHEEIDRFVEAVEKARAFLIT